MTPIFIVLTYHIIPWNVTPKPTFNIKTQHWFYQTCFYCLIVILLYIGFNFWIIREGSINHNVHSTTICKCMGSHNTIKITKDLYLYIGSWWWLYDESKHVARVVRKYNKYRCVWLTLTCYFIESTSHFSPKWLNNYALEAKFYSVHYVRDRHIS